MPQSLSYLYTHIVFATKIRLPLLAPEWRNELFRLFGTMSGSYGCEPIQIGGYIDHVHLLLRLSPTIAPATFIGKIKSSSSIWVQERKQIEFAWQRGYAIFSVSPSILPRVQNYIRNQEAHHANTSFEDEINSWLKVFGTEWVFHDEEDDEADFLASANPDF